MKRLLSLLVVLGIGLAYGCSSSNNPSESSDTLVNHDVAQEDNQIDQGGTGGDTINDIQDTANETQNTNNKYSAIDKLATSVNKDLIDANNRFAIKIFKAINKAEGPDKNVFISPLSISIDLAMVYNGAVGETKDAMAKVLEFQGIKLDKLDKNFKFLIKSLTGVDDSVVLDIANSIWMNKGFQPKSSFLAVLVNYFMSEVFVEDFKDPKTVDKVNNWISKNTGGMIKKMLNAISDSAVMLLINAIYFKADWTYPFDPEKTYKGDFELANGQKVKTDLMRNSDSNVFKIYQGEHYTVVRLPYGRQRLAFYGFAPSILSNGNDSIEDFINNMSLDKINEYIGKLKKPEEGEVESVVLPKFKINFKKELKDILTDLGMGPAFNGGLDDIASNVFISRVLHQAVIQVDEKGTEAAAATITEVNASLPPSFMGTKPFFFLIRDDYSGSIIFMGKLANPVQN